MTQYTAYETIYRMKADSDHDTHAKPEPLLVIRTYRTQVVSHG